MKRLSALAALSGVLLFFCFPNVLGLEFGPLGFVALVPFLFALDRAERPHDAAKLAVAAGVPAHALLYHWLTHTFTVYAAMGWAVSIAILILMILVMSLYFMLFAAVRHLLVRFFRWPGLVATPVVWVAVEYFRGVFPFGGFPWNLLGYTQHAFLPAVQIAEWTGPYGVSFIVALANAGVAGMIGALGGEREESRPEGRSHNQSRPGGRSYAGPVVALLVPALACAFGAVRIGQVDRAFAAQPARTLGIVQANIDQGTKWDEGLFWNDMSRHMRLTRTLMPEKPELVIWPEAAVTVAGFNLHWAQRSRVIEYLAAVDAYFLVGSISLEPCGPDTCGFNSAYLLAPRATELLGRYDKMHLVPFGEYVPLKWLFFFADNIAHGNTGSTTPGRELRVMSIPGLVFGVPICYEVIFPDQVRRFAKDGANFMVTITNDAWFGQTGAPYQHHAAVVFRAVENRVYFARAANTGVSSIVDPAGRVVRETPIYQEAAFIGTVKASPMKTFYSAHGDWFTRLCAAPVLALMLYWAFRKIKEGKS